MPKGLGRIDYVGWGAPIGFSERLSMRILPLLAVVSDCLASTAFARVVDEVEPNDTLKTAQDIDSPFNWDIEFDPDIESSDELPHVTIKGSGNNKDIGSFDYYKFSVSAAGVRGIFDIDYGGKPGDASIDTELFLYAADGTLLQENDESMTSQGLSGSSDSSDSYISHEFAAAGIYIVGVGRFSSFDSGILGEGIQGNSPYEGQTYVLQISIGDHPMSDRPPPFPGDANHDGKVDLSDFGIVKANFGSNTAAWEQGDFDADSKVTLTDFGIVKANFGKVQTSGAAAPVPEPSTVLLALLGGLMLLCSLKNSKGKV
jgi:hypothetical protein